MKIFIPTIIIPPKKFIDKIIKGNTKNYLTRDIPHDQMISIKKSLSKLNMKKSSFKE